MREKKLLTCGCVYTIIEEGKWLCDKMCKGHGDVLRRFIIVSPEKVDPNDKEWKGMHLAIVDEE